MRLLSENRYVLTGQLISFDVSDNTKRKTFYPFKDVGSYIHASQREILVIPMMDDESIDLEACHELTEPAHNQIIYDINAKFKTEYLPEDF
jgi:hypothetical protein